MKENLSHAEMIESMTGGMVIPSREFAGSNRLHPDGRPKKAFRDQLRKISNFKNSFSVILSLLLPPLIVWVSMIYSHPLIWIFLILCMGIAQNRLFIIHHEAAHRLLFSNQKINDLILN